MKVEARIFELVTVFFIIIAIVYGVFTAIEGELEWAGLTAMVLAAGLAMIVGTYFRFVARRLDTRPEDYEDAEISDGSGDLGFFSPHSWWPILVAFSAGIFAIGFALWLPWLFIFAIVLILMAAAGLVFEYHVGPERH
ncbi:cytochrome c oxidase subunit 4 [Tomitella fengzijianii]|uniref:Cytochrome c oxidase polypeptide 4 n=1 Tax=Tomitella fengzijianii TaxID=2597660 RepID=A0A516X4C2_9ACTN|nr:cytochrome c oxidase subunit 4 [Tomitella fengzijianii]QDQ97904.1 cytochrome c oxidase subunit 4 [Tomitella fengzijianii]